MEPCLLISYLNDFIFCPRSIYFHQLYDRLEQRLYQTTAQTRGKAAHWTIDSRRYTTAKNILQGIDVYSEKYTIGGKIDLYDKSKFMLTERKKKIRVVYDGYIYQLYAQYHCLLEMGYEVKKLRLYSMDDNRVYPVKTPREDPQRQRQFEILIEKIKHYNPGDSLQINPNKCTRCIYNPVCDVTKC